MASDKPGAVHTVIFLAVVSLFLHDKNQRSPIGTLGFRVTGILGRGELLFSPPAIISIVAAYQASFDIMASLLLYWLLLTIGRPVELIAEAQRRFKEERIKTGNQPTVGMISRIDHPNIVRIKLTSANSWNPNHLFTVSMPDGSQKFVVSLFSQVQGIEVVGTGLCVGTVTDKISLPNGMVCSSHDKEKTASFLESLSGTKDARLVGFVVEN